MIDSFKAEISAGDRSLAPPFFPCAGVHAWARSAPSDPLARAIAVHFFEGVSREVSLVPHGESRAEAGARMQADISIMKELRLPRLHRGANEPLYVWPPLVPSPAQQMAQAMLDNPVALHGPFQLAQLARWD
jgi:hypothetical protein